MYRVYCMFTIHLYTVKYISFASKQNSLRLEQECLTLRFIQAGINNEILICFRVAWKATFFAKFGLHFFKWQAKGLTANTLFWIGLDFWDKERKSILKSCQYQKAVWRIQGVLIRFRIRFNFDSDSNFNKHYYLNFSPLHFF